MITGSFFPFTKKLAENENFKAFPPAHRIYFLLLVSEFNLRGKFYKSDLEVAVTISASPDTIRRARKEFQRLEWIKARPGFWTKGERPVATTYFNVEFSRVEDGEFFAPVHRFAYEALLYRLRTKRIGHKEMLMFPYICYFDAKYREEEDFFISKRELCDIAGMPEAPAAVLRLNDEQFFGEESLYEIVDIYHKIKILKHRSFADPEDDEVNRENAEQYRQDIKMRLESAKAKLSLPKKRKGVSVK